VAATFGSESLVKFTDEVGRAAACIVSVATFRDSALDRNGALEKIGDWFSCSVLGCAKATCCGAISKSFFLLRNVFGFQASESIEEFSSGGCHCVAILSDI